MKKRAFNLFFREDQLASLRACQADTGAPVAVLVRRAVDAYLLRWRREDDSRRDLSVVAAAKGRK